MLLVAIAAIVGSHLATPAGFTGPRMLRIVVGDGYLRAPQHVAPGQYRIHFASEGRATHQLQIAKLPDGAGLESLDSLLPDGGPLSWVRFQPAGVSPLRGSRDVLTKLEPGRYVLVVLSDGSDYRPVHRTTRILTVSEDGSEQ